MPITQAQPQPPEQPAGEAAARIPRMFYTNASNLAYGVFDFRILFADQGPAASGEVVTRSVIEVVMSPQHMKSFAAAMAAKVVEYERAYGPIPQDPEEKKENASPAANE